MSTSSVLEEVLVGDPTIPIDDKRLGQLALVCRISLDLAEILKRIHIMQRLGGQGQRLSDVLAPPVGDEFRKMAWFTIILET